MVMTDSLLESLTRIAQAASGAADPWWIIGSAAVVLHGGAMTKVRDVDLMMSARDADEFLDRVGGSRVEASMSSLFRSAVFGTWTDPPVPVEVFGGFELSVRGTWQAVILNSREPIRVGESRVFVPSRADLVRLLHSFGRDKDLKRARLLQA